MAKKSFRNSPAMQFITQAPPAEVSKPGKEQAKPPSLKPEAKSEVSPQTPAPVFENREKQKPKTKEKEAPETGRGGAGESASDLPPVPMKPNPEYIETRSKRVQLLMQPSLHGGLLKIAKEQGASFNELIHEVLSDYLKQQTQPEP